MPSSIALALIFFKSRSVIRILIRLCLFRLYRAYFSYSFFSFFASHIFLCCFTVWYYCFQKYFFIILNIRFVRCSLFSFLLNQGFSNHELQQGSLSFSPQQDK